MKKTMEGREKWPLALRAIFLVVLMSSILAISSMKVDAAPLPETAYSVTYVANGAASGSVPMDSNTYAETDSVQVLPNTGGLIREGYVFGGWRNDNSIYQPNETFTMETSDVILSAVWIPIYSVSYDGNMNFSGYAPVDSQLYPGGAYVTVLANSRNLDKSFGFKCWNTKADGSGSSYYPNDTLRMGTGNITLYAIYHTTPPVILVSDDYTVTYYKNGATSGFVPIDNTKNAYITVTGNAGSLFRDGYAFAGWNTKADGGGTTYQPEDTVYLSASLTLYALWNPVYTVNYDPNGGEAYFATSHQYSSGAKVKLVDYAGFIQPPSGKVFAGWNTIADGTGTAYMPDDVVTISSDLTLYPVWDQYVYNKQSVVFRGNGNTDGSVPAMRRLTNGQTVTLSGQGTLKRDGYIFDGWFYDSTYYYKAGDSVGVWGYNITLYAKWVAVCTVTYDSNKATGGTVPVDSATYIPGVQVTVINDTGGLYRDGFLVSWNTKPDGSGASYWPGASFTISADTTLYAMYSMVILVPPEPLGKGVYYYGNRAESGVAPEDSLGYAVGNTVTVQNNPGNLTRYGYNFAGWNTRADGTGVTYQPGATFSYPANKGFVALFAVWNEVIISQIRNLEYNGNGNSGGNSPDSEYIDVGGSLPVSGRNTLYKMGYEFVNWNTHADGNGTTYWPGNSISSTGNVIILYAQWTGQTNFTHVSYQVNASYGTYTGTLPTDSWLYPAGALISVKSSDIAISGRYFAGWNTKADMSGKTYLPGDTIIMEYDNITLYAVFLASKPFYVFYNGNGNTGGTPPTDAKRYSCGYSAGQTVTVANEYTMSKGTEYFFAGWNTAPDGSGITYKGGETFPIGSENVTLYGIWKTYPNSATVTYNDNGSTSGIAPTGSTLYPFGTLVTLAANSGNLLKTGYIFYGWWVNGALYKPGATFTMPNRSVTVYAVWASTATFGDTYRVTYNGNGSTGGTVPSDSTSYLPVESVMLAGNTGKLVRPGYAFGGWSDRISLYEPGQTFIMGSAQGNITLYAVWLPIYTMSYEGNGNTGGSVPIDTSVYKEGQSATVLGNVNNMVRTIYLFDGWYVNSRFYHPGDTLVFGASGVTATAVWVYAPSDDASLYDLTAGGSTVGGFAAGQYEYQVQLPYGTLPGSATAMVDATAADTNATVQITQAANLPGDATVTVTSVSQVTTSTYTIHFTLEAEANTPPNRKASVPAAATASVTIGDTYTLNLSDIFEDVNSDPLTYQVSVNGSVYGAASTVYMYQLTSVGQTTLVFKANDGTADSVDTYTVTLTANAALGTAPIITISSLPAGTVGTAYSRTLVATGDMPIIWSIASGSLPDGLTLNPSTGVISGTPTNSGTFTLTVKAENSTGNDTQALSIEINLATLTAVVLQSATADGVADTITSAKIDLIFNTAITGLTADDITITSGTGAVVKGALTGSGTAWFIALTSVTTQGNVSVAVTSPAGYSISGSPKTLAVYKEVTETTPPTISPALRNYDLSDPQDVSTDITWNSAASVTDVVCSSGHLTTPSAFTISDDALVIKDTYLSGLSPSAGDTLAFEIIFNTGATATLTVNVVDGHTPSSDATLNDLKVGGTTVSGFSAGVNSYNVELPYGTLPGSVAPTVSATASDPLAHIDITQASVIPGSATVVVTAEAGTQKTYTINFTLGVPNAHSITVLNDGHGAGSANPILAAQGTPITLSSSPSSGYHFKEWLVISPVSMSITGNTCTMPDEAMTVRAVFEVDAVTTYTVTFNSDGSAYDNKTVQAGASIGSADWPANPTKSGYTFGGWFTGTNGSGSAFTSVTPVNATMTVYAKWTSNGGGGGGGGSSTPSTPETKSYTADIKVTDMTGSGTKETTLPITVDTDTGRVTVDLSSQSNLVSGGGSSVIALPSIPDVDTYTLGIPVPYLSASDKQGTLTVDTEMGSITIPSNMLTGIAGASGNKAKISISQGDKSSLPEDVKSAVGNRPLIQLSVSIDGKQTEWNNPDAPVTVTIPYTPTAAELLNPESIVIWYIDGSDKAVSVPNGRYDPATGTVNFFTTHFSHYAVAYVHKTFSDLGGVEWARKAIEVMASKGITSGTGNDTFSPSVNITGADYMVFLVNTLGLTADFTDNFDDVKPGTYYYDAVGIAKKLGIAPGIGNNLFNPTENISRQDMMVLAARALEKYKGLKAANDNTVLEMFSDKGDIAEYAVNSLATLVKAGLIEGSENKLNPRSSTTRAEVAVFLYNIYNKYPEAPIIAVSTLSRLAGQSKIDTALSIAKAAYADKVTNAVLATADNYPDALAGSVLAYQLDAPILLVGSSEADQEKVIDYLKSKLEQEGTVYILGGTAVVGSGMEDKLQISGFKHITRIAGETRYETSVKISEHLNVKSGTPVVLVSGENYPDALSVSSIAAQNQFPILLVAKDGISDAVSQRIAAIKPDKVYIIGLQGAISPDMENQVARITGLAAENIVRIGGVDRYATSLALAEYFNLGSQTVCIATGNNFQDALAGSVYAAKYKAPIILTDSSLPEQTMNYIQSRKPAETAIFGGEAVIGKDIEQQLRELAKVQS